MKLKTKIDWVWDDNIELMDVMDGRIIVDGEG